MLTDQEILDESRELVQHHVDKARFHNDQAKKYLQIVQILDGEKTSAQQPVDNDDDFDVDPDNDESDIFGNNTDFPNTIIGKVAQSVAQGSEYQNKLVTGVGLDDEDEGKSDSEDNNGFEETKEGIKQDEEMFDPENGDGLTPKAPPRKINAEGRIPRGKAGNAKRILTPAQERHNQELLAKNKGIVRPPAVYSNTTPMGIAKSEDLNHY